SVFIVTVYHLPGMFVAAYQGGLLSVSCRRIIQMRTRQKYTGKRLVGENDRLVKCKRVSGISESSNPVGQKKLCDFVIIHRVQVSIDQAGQERFTFSVSDLRIFPELFDCFAGSHMGNHSLLNNDKSFLNRLTTVTIDDPDVLNQQRGWI